MKSSEYPLTKQARKPEINITTDEFDLCVVPRLVSTYIHIYIYISADENKTFPAYSKHLQMINDNITILAGEEEVERQFQDNISQHLV